MFGPLNADLLRCGVSERRDLARIVLELTNLLQAQRDPQRPRPSRLILHPHSAAGTIISIPATLATCRAAYPQSTNRPAMYAPTAIVSMQNPRSAANTRPRKRSSVFSCNSVVEKTHTVDPPMWASTMHRHAIHK